MLIENDHSKKAKYLSKREKFLGSSENRILKTFFQAIPSGGAVFGKAEHI